MGLLPPPIELMGLFAEQTQTRTRSLMWVVMIAALVRVDPFPIELLRAEPAFFVQLARSAYSAIFNAAEPKSPLKVTLTTDLVPPVVVIGAHQSVMLSPLDGLAVWIEVKVSPAAHGPGAEPSQTVFTVRLRSARVPTMMKWPLVTGAVKEMEMALASLVVISFF